MSAEEKYEELRKYFENSEQREQGYIVTIQRLMQQIKDLKASK